MTFLFSLENFNDRFGWPQWLAEAFERPSGDPYAIYENPEHYARGGSPFWINDGEGNKKMLCWNDEIVRNPDGSLKLVDMA